MPLLDLEVQLHFPLLLRVLRALALFLGSVVSYTIIVFCWMSGLWTSRATYKPPEALRGRADGKLVLGPRALSQSCSQAGQASVE